MLHTIEDGEVVGEDPIPSNIGALVDVHDEEETDEDPGEIKSNEFAEEGTKLNHIEGFTVVHEATENFRSIPKKVAYGLDAEPGTHEGGTVFLVGKLEIVQAESDTKEKNDNPVKDLEKEASESYGSVVLASANIAQLVFDNRNKSRE